jgi:hypothetical protein
MDHHHRDNAAADLVSPTLLDLLVTDKRGRQRHLMVASEWPEIAAAPELQTPQQTTPGSAQGVADLAVQNIHHIAIRMGRVIAQPAAVTLEIESPAEAADTASTADTADTAEAAAAEADVTDPQPVAGDGNTAPDSPTPT